VLALNFHIQEFYYNKVGVFGTQCSLTGFLLTWKTWKNHGILLNWKTPGRLLESYVSFVIFWHDKSIYAEVSGEGIWVLKIS